ncbi:MAG TPA: hypothetical protein VJH06_00080 [Candidatus Paceibacterota bacterium]
MRSTPVSIAIIRPKQPYIKWANSLPDRDREYTEDVFKKDCLTLLIPKYTDEKEALEHINKIWQDIFNEELHRWSPNQAWYPKDMTQKNFSQWFDVEFQAEVFDSIKYAKN